MLYRCKAGISNLCQQSKTENNKCLKHKSLLIYSLIVNVCIHHLHFADRVLSYQFLHNYWSNEISGNSNRKQGKVHMNAAMKY